MSFLFSLFLSGCGDENQMRDLKNYVAKLKQNMVHTQKKEITSEYKLPEAVKYGADTPETGMTTPKDNIPPLQAYPIKSLQFVGTVTQNQQTYAYLMTPDAMVYQAKVGDIIGDSYGKIIKIDSGHIDVLQRNAVTGSASKQQVITLQLKE